MPSSKDRRRIEVAVDLYDRLKLLADSEERTLTNVIQDLLQLGLKHYQSTWLPHFFRERFNGQARQALALAEEEAKSLGHDYVGTEHLLLGLLRQNEGIAAQVLRQLWIDLDKTRKGLVYILAYGAKARAAATPAVVPIAAQADAPTAPTPATPVAPASPTSPTTPTPSVAVGATETEAPGMAGGAEAEPEAAPEASQVAYTLRMRKVLDLAVYEAQRLGHDYVGTEHLLLALEREGEGLAAGLLRTFGALGRVREFTLAALRQQESADAE